VTVIRSSTERGKTVLHPVSDRRRRRRSMPLCSAWRRSTTVRDDDGGGLVATVSDPDGNVLGLAQDR
jgi:hypothetical protein